MSVSITRGGGVTVLTVKANPSSVCPPFCQILSGLCYNPTCCSASSALRSFQKSSQSVLGAVLILSGVFSISLAMSVSLSGARWQDDPSAFPFWLGSVFVSLGVTAILSEKFPTPCLVILNVILQLAGVCFSATAVVLYCINIATLYLWDFCQEDDYDNYSYHHLSTTPHPSPEDSALKQACLDAKQLATTLLLGISGVLLVLAVLQLCVTISSSVLGIKALRSIGSSKAAPEDDPEASKPLME